MAYEVLYNFISPVTGRILCDPTKVLVGDVNGIAIPSAFIPFGSLPNLTHNYFWVGDAMNRPVETPVGAFFPPLLFNNLWIGNSLDQATAFPNIQINNLPPLGLGNAWIGNNEGRPVEAKLVSLIKIEIENTLALNPIFNITPIFFVTGGPSGRNGQKGLAGLPGAATDAGIPTLVINANLDINNARIENIAPSPLADYDAVNAKWVYDLLNDNVEIIWAN
jgi:hypothetical protein